VFAESEVVALTSRPAAVYARTTMDESRPPEAASVTVPMTFMACAELATRAQQSDASASERSPARRRPEPPAKASLRRLLYDDILGEDRQY